MILNINCPKRAVCCRQAPSFVGRQGRVCVASVLALQVFTAQGSFDELLLRTCIFPEAHDGPFSGGRLLWSINVLLEARPAASPLSPSMVPAPAGPGLPSRQSPRSSAPFLWVLWLGGCGGRVAGSGHWGGGRGTYALGQRPHCAPRREERSAQPRGPAGSHACLGGGECDLGH